VYIGGLYDDKRLDVILGSMRTLVAEYPYLELHLAGVGPEQEMVEAFAKEHEWCTYAGSVFGEARDRLLFSATAIVMPGAVGLVAIDSFHYATPILTTSCDNHGPEVSYLQDRENALILDNHGNVQSYTRLVRKFLESESLADQLRDGCRESAKRYDIKDTAANFVKGVLALK